MRGVNVRTLTDDALSRRIARCIEINNRVSCAYNRNARRLTALNERNAAGKRVDDLEVSFCGWLFHRHLKWMDAIEGLVSTYQGEVARRRFQALDDTQLSSALEIRTDDAERLRAVVGHAFEALVELESAVARDRDEIRHHEKVITSAEHDRDSADEDVRDLRLEVTRRSALSAHGTLAEYRERVSRAE
ncbi:hypothetical protein Q4543_20315 [Salipiger sp. 1_MG-2023]|uniref:hypothetical protein n=1 Tax=Salipiger sp. 1_MG-2023 TaxID=3062665 RepID=UPI0026E23722|nr:hypothetical protein [Salipiger sp. 1_MG-2023]MDO6587861.1 hypothetical protein [Salipiger sp. 1_MG-2023]